MDNPRLGTVVQRLYHLAAGSLTDSQLLARFVSRRDEAAFELLLRRHSALVWGVCRRILGNAQDADDAFQATFLVLLRRARSLDRSGPLSGWLHGVACRVAVRARKNAAHRTVHERAAAQQNSGEGYHDRAAERYELSQFLDVEMDRLPQAYRTPLILCYLEGLTHEQAAQQLGWPLGTLKSRLRRAQEKVRDRLIRRGLGSRAPLPALPAMMAPPALVVDTANAAFHFASGAASTGHVSAEALALTNGVLKAMASARIKSVAVLLLAATLFFGGLGGLKWRASAVGSGAGAVTAAEHGDRESKPAEKSDKPGEKSEKPVEPAPIGEKLEALWADLGSEDEAKSWRAAFVLATDPKEATRLLSARLKPVVADADKLKKLIRLLDDDEFATRDAALEALKDAGEIAVPYLRNALTAGPSPEAKQRIEAILNAYKGQSPATARTIRATVVLEAIGNDDARKVLQAAIKGDPEAFATRAAKSALERLEGKPDTWEARWKDLGGTDETRALRAAISVVTLHKEALPFIKEKLAKGLPTESAEPDAKVIEKLVADLSAVNFNDRQKATTDLIALGPAAIPMLEKTLQGAQDLETRRRLEEILQQAKKAPVPPPSAASVNRLTAALTHLDSAESRELLEAVRKAQGPDARRATSPDHSRCAIIDEKGAVRMIDAATGKLLWVRELPGGAAKSIRFSTDGKSLSATDVKGGVTAIDVTTGEPIRS
jgi:RNA polymerase sigma factor (sigma-70 family)